MNAVDPPLASEIAGDVQHVPGIAYCAVHDDFAIEGYDWADVCHAVYVDGVTDPDDADCRLAPMYRAVTA